jgi:phosphoglycerate dehydrogenase-like enzyme
MLREAGFEIRPQRDERMSRGLSGAAEFSEALRGAAAILAWGERYTDEVLANCPDLRVIARRGVGYDRVDMAAASARGVVVAITPNANHEAVAEHTLALMLAVTKSIVLGDRDTRAGLWPRRRITPLRGSTLGIVGLGRIGRSTAERALAMRMRVIASDPYADPDYAARQGIERVSLDELLARADIVSVHCPLSDETRGMIDKDALAAMKPDAVLINTARGAIVVEEDLAEALASGQLAGAGIDAYETEPVGADNPLFGLDNVVVSAHIAGDDWLASRDMDIEAAQVVIDLYNSRWPEDAVLNKELKGRWTW